MKSAQPHSDQHHLHRAPGSAEESLLSPIPETTSLADEIAFRLEAAILSGELAPGARLRQEELCEKFGVSRTPIREALRKLQAQRLVVVIPNKGAAVRIPSRKEIEEIYDLRAELESYAAEIACANATPAMDRELAEAAEQVEHHQHGKDGRDTAESRFNIEISGAIRNFHHIIQHAAASERLVSMVRTLETSFPGDFCCHEMAEATESDTLHLDEHDGIRAAIAARDAARARTLMREHIQHAKQILLRYLDDRGFWGDAPDRHGSAG